MLILGQGLSVVAIAGQAGSTEMAHESPASVCVLTQGEEECPREQHPCH